MLAEPKRVLEEVLSHVQSVYILTICHHDRVPHPWGSKPDVFGNHLRYQPWLSTGLISWNLQCGRYCRSDAWRSEKSPCRRSLLLEEVSFVVIARIFLLTELHGLHISVSLSPAATL